MARTPDLSKNLNAFLDTIAFSEGTKDMGDDGYNVLCGGNLFASYASHPRLAIKTRWGLSDAAGRYQIMAAIPGKITTDTWDWASKTVGVKDFSPLSQDAVCVYLIKRRNALDDVNAGRFDQAVTKCALEWASLPGSPYGQHTNQLDALRAKYISLGGGIA